MTKLPNAQLTHMGLYVHDMDVMVEFYTRLLGLIVVDAGDFQGKELTFLSRSAHEHHQMVMIKGRTAGPDVRILGQISFRVDSLDALKFFHVHAASFGVRGLEARNHGNSWSIYFFDPEGNFVEIYVPTPWYVGQPWRVALDLSLSNDEIEATTLGAIRSDATCKPVEEWERDMAARLGEVPA